jgi:hypothetical protein
VARSPPAARSGTDGGDGLLVTRRRVWSIPCVFTSLPASIYGAELLMMQNISLPAHDFLFFSFLFLFFSFHLLLDNVMNIDTLVVGCQPFTVLL